MSFTNRRPPVTAANKHLSIIRCQFTFGIFLFLWTLWAIESVLALVMNNGQLGSLGMAF